MSSRGYQAPEQKSGHRDNPTVLFFCMGTISSFGDTFQIGNALRNGGTDSKTDGLKRSHLGKLREHLTLATNQ